MKSTGLRQQIVMTQLKKKLRRRHRKDFLKKMGHVRNVNIIFMENICNNVMIYSKNSMQPTRVSVVLIVGPTRWRNKPIFDTIHYLVLIDIREIMDICFMVWTTGFNMMMHDKDCHMFCLLFDKECLGVHGLTFCFWSKLDLCRVGENCRTFNMKLRI